MAQLRTESDASIVSAAQKEAGAGGLEVAPTRSHPTVGATGPLVLDETNAVEHTAYMFSTKKKWWILTVVALCQTSMSK